MTKMQPIPSIAKQAKFAVLDEFIEQIDKAKNANKNKTPYGFIPKLIKEAKSVCPWITRHCIMNRMQSRPPVGSSHSRLMEMGVFTIIFKPPRRRREKEEEEYFTMSFPLQF